MKVLPIILKIILCLRLLQLYFVIFLALFLNSEWK